jgi:MFS family permease
MVKSKNFWIIAIGQFMSQLGNIIQRMALSLYILDITGSAKVFSIILAISMLPQLLLAPLGGAIADRFNKKKIMIGLDILSGIILLIFSFVASRFELSVITIGGLVFILQVIESIYDPASRAAIVNVVRKEELAKANSIITGITAITMLIGPVAAGLLYGLCEIKFIFIINLTSFFISASIECFLKIRYRKVRLEQSPIRVFKKDIKDSINFLYKNNKFIFAMVIIGTATNIFLMPIYSIGVPYIEKQIYGVTSIMYGISEGVVGIGMIVGALLNSCISKKIPMEKFYKFFNILLIAEIIMGIVVMPFMINSNGISYLAYSIFTLSGFIFAVVITNLNIICNTYIQTRTPSSMIGKITSLLTVLSIIFMTAGQGIFGFLYEALTKELFYIYAIVAICTIICGVVSKICINKYLLSSEKLNIEINFVDENL